MKRIPTLLQSALPQHSLSRFVAQLAEAETPWLKNALIRCFLARYKVDLAEAQNEDIAEYRCFNDFFTRALKPGSRPLDPTPDSLIYPADGQLSEFGLIKDQCLIQAKNSNYTTAQLLGDPLLASQFDGGSFATIYLSPSNYHRVHIPTDGELKQQRYIPGRLFSVNHQTTQMLPGLFTRNERLVCVFSTEFGTIALVLVGAMLVAGIQTQWQSYYAPQTFEVTQFENQSHIFNKGDEIGRFKFGSTVILLLPKTTKLCGNLVKNSTVRFGQCMGSYFK